MLTWRRDPRRGSGLPYDARDRLDSTMQLSNIQELCHQGREKRPARGKPRLIYQKRREYHPEFLQDIPRVPRLVLAVMNSINVTGTNSGFDGRATTHINCISNRRNLYTLTIHSGQDIGSKEGVSFARP